MSTSSCPQCGKQITIPSGVGTSAKVRCPLCHSQYTLADALVNMPPLLELVDEDAEDYLDTQPAIPGGLTVSAATLMPNAPVSDAADEPIADVDFGDSDAIELDDLDEPAAAEPLDLEATTAYVPREEAEPVRDFDDLTVEDKDTEVEELSAASGEPVGEDATGELISFDLESSADDEADEIALDFGAASSGASDDAEAPIQFDDELASEADAEDSTLSFDMPDATDSAGEPAIDFGAPDAAEVGAETDEMALDFGQPVEDLAPVVAAGDADSADAADPTDAKGKKKKNKEKKQKVKAADGEPRPKRRLSTLLSATFGGLLGLIVAVYGMVWLGPDYDFLGLGKMLPQAMVPSSFHKPTDVATQKPALEMTPPVAQPEPSEPVETAPVEPAADVPAEPATNEATPAEAPATEPAADAPTASPDATPAEPSPTEPGEPATAGAAEPGQPELPPADAPADEPGEPAATAEPPSDPLTDPAADPFAPSVTAKEMPAVDPVTDAPPMPEPEAPLPATPAPPVAEPPAEEMPAAADDPFADSTTKPAAADDPFADSAPALEAPAEPAAVEPVGPVNAAKVSPAELAQAIQDAETADRQMLAAQGTAAEADLKRIRSNFYVSLFRMADGATFVKDEADSGQLEALRLQMDRLVRQLAADPKRIESLKFNAGRWLDFSRRTTPGIILAGKVQSVEPVGKLHEIKLNIGLENAAESIVSVLSATDPGVNDGDEAVVLGAIVENPAEALAGYEGTEPTVIWNGLLLTLSPQ